MNGREVQNYREEEEMPRCSDQTDSKKKNLEDNLQKNCEKKMKGLMDGIDDEWDMENNWIGLFG